MTNKIFFKELTITTDTPHKNQFFEKGVKKRDVNGTKNGAAPVEVCV